MAKYYKMEQRDSFDMHKTRTVYRLQHVQSISGEEFIQKVAHRRSFSRELIQAVLSEVSEELALLLGNAYAVTVPGIGSFSLGIRLKEERQEQLDEEQEAVEEGTAKAAKEPNARNIKLHHLNFRKDKELFKEVCIRFDKLELERTGGRQGRRITIDDKTQSQRIAAAHEYLREHQFMHINDYARVTGLSYSSAQRELRELVKYKHSGITYEGRGSHRIYVLG